MLELLRFVRRRRESSQAEFTRWWLEEVGARVVHAGGVERFVLSTAIEDGDTAPGQSSSDVWFSADTAGYHGCSQLWFSSEEQAARFYASPAYRDALTKEEEGVHGAATFELVTRRHVIIEQIRIEQATRLLTMICAMRRKAAMTVQAFQEYYLNEHTQYTTKNPGQRAYDQLHTISGRIVPGEPKYDGVSVVWLDDRAGYTRLLASEELQRSIADASEFVDMGSITTILAEDHRLVWP
jgi:uncharacterized protein (TIGR02118 family)